jgi:hypothetical protein
MRPLEVRRAELEEKIARSERQLFKLRAALVALLEPKPRKTHPVEDALVNGYRDGGKTLSMLGAEHGISGEYARQIIIAYEARTGEKLPRKKAPRERRPVTRVTWQCSDCGQSRMVTPSFRAQRCRKCSRLAILRISDDAVIQAIAMRKAGMPWADVCRSLGEHPYRHQPLASRIWRRLRAEGQLTTPEITAIFGNGWLWLARQHPADHASIRQQ